MGTRIGDGGWAKYAGSAKAWQRQGDSRGHQWKKPKRREVRGQEAARQEYKPKFLCAPQPPELIMAILSMFQTPQKALWSQKQD